MNAGKSSVNEIFNLGRTLEIPFFQRSYVWGRDNWERFLSDLLDVSEQNKPYFIGSIILKQQNVSSTNKNGDWRSVIDGQQRLTTFVLFSKVVCELQTENKEWFKKIFFNMSGEFILKHNRSDMEIFEAIVNEDLSEKLSDKYKENKVLLCYNYFLKNEDLLKKINYQTILNRLYFLAIDLGIEENEQQIFDTINSLGVSLTTAELLKNYLFNRDLKLFEKTWEKVFESGEDVKNYWDQEVTSGREHRVNIDLFLQAYLLIKSDAHDKYSSLSYLFENYKSFLETEKINKASFSEELVTYAEPYKKNINPDLLNEDIDKDSPIERLNVLVFGINTTTVVPYILYLLSGVKKENELNEILKLLESYLTRRLICRFETKNYNNLFASLIRGKVKDVKALKEKIKQWSLTDSMNMFPDDKILEKSVLENHLSNQQAKMVLYLIEKSIEDGNESTALKPFSEYSVEHVMPKKWINNWKNLDGRDEQERNDSLRTLGNLTIIMGKLNSALSDANWKVKKTGKKNHKGLIFYSSGIKIFQDYLGLDDWNEDVIKKRGTVLANHAIKIWGI